MADYEIVDVTKLQKAEGVKDGDTLLLIRQQGDGTSICMRTDGAQFKGTDAYDVAKANGFSGTREEAREKEYRYNEMNNQGGYGYVPRFYSAEDEQWILERLSKAKAIIERIGAEAQE